jgi:hypothetical protein
LFRLLAIDGCEAPFVSVFAIKGKPLFVQVAK